MNAIINFLTVSSATYLRAIAALVIPLFLSACSALTPWFPEQANTTGSAEPAMRVTDLQEPLQPHNFVLKSPRQKIIGQPQIVYSREEDTFSLLAREYGLGYDELVDANPGVDPWLPGEGTAILLPTQYILPDAPNEGVVLNIASKRLFYFPKPDAGEPQVVMTFPIGIGRVGWETPVGSSKIISRARDPHWYVPASVRAEHRAKGDPLPAVVPPGPDNPLGHRVLKLDLPGYLIHGTNQPYGVGMRVSHGCVRMYPENIELLYELVAIGEKVTIVNQPYLSVWHEGEFFVEAHRPLEDDAIDASVHSEKIIQVFEAEQGQESRNLIARDLQLIQDESLGIPFRAALNDVSEMFGRARYVHNTVVPDPNMMSLSEARALLDAESDEGGASE